MIIIKMKEDVQELLLLEDKSSFDFEEITGDQISPGNFSSIFVKEEPLDKDDKQNVDDSKGLLEPEIIVQPVNKEFETSLDMKPKHKGIRCSANLLESDDNPVKKDIKKKKKKIQIGSDDASSERASCETCGGSCLPRSCDNIQTNEGQTMYGCGLCENRVFKLLKSLKIHLKMHAGLYQCEICGKRVSNNSQLREHSRSHTKEKPFVCPDAGCSKAFSYSCKLKEHMRTHSGELPYACPMCPQRFVRSDHMRRHMQQHTGEMFMCQFESCGRMFSCRSSLKEHVLKHSGVKPYKCDICDKSFAKSTKLRIHQRTHTGEKPWGCDVCQRMFSCHDKYKRHTGARDNGDFMCSFCEAKLCSLSDMKSHINSEHGDQRPHACPLCDRSFKTRPQLSTHMRSHRPKLTCSFCDRSYAAASDLRIHESSHRGEFPVQCGKCEERFATKYNLKRHMQKVHSTLPPIQYNCSLCPATFGTGLRLKHHALKHVGDNLFKCEVCGVGFNTLGSMKHHLRVHRKATDDGIKQFACNFCDKSFKYSSSLMVHTRRHTGVNFKCPICGRPFFRQERVKKHMMAVHHLSAENFYEVDALTDYPESNDVTSTNGENSEDSGSDNYDFEDDKEGLFKGEKKDQTYNGIDFDSESIKSTESFDKC